MHYISRIGLEFTRKSLLWNTFPSQLKILNRDSTLSVLEGFSTLHFTELTHMLSTCIDSLLSVWQILFISKLRKFNSEGVVDGLLYLQTCGCLGQISKSKNEALCNCRGKDQLIFSFLDICIHWTNFHRLFMKKYGWEYIKQVAFGEEQTTLMYYLVCDVSIKITWGSLICLCHDLWLLFFEILYKGFPNEHVACWLLLKSFHIGLAKYIVMFQSSGKGPFMISYSSNLVLFIIISLS